MKKNIQLRGISRTPSYRMVEDGGCDESINVLLDNTESAPALDPVLANLRYGSQHNPYMLDTPLYIHRNGYEHLICRSGNSLVYYPKNSGQTVAGSLGYTLSSGEEIREITNIGNMLIVCTSLRIEYILWKDDAYVDLGDKIPEPKVYFQTKVFKTSANGGSVPVTGTTMALAENYQDDTAGIKTMKKATWEGVLNGQNQNEQYAAEYAEVCADVWDLIKGQVTRLKESKYFSVPVMARVALKLKLGADDKSNYIYQSVPILLGAGFTDMIAVEGLSSGTPNDNDWNSSLKAYIKHAFKVNVQTDMGSGYYDDWLDIVDSVDIFLSTDIFPALNKNITSIGDHGTVTTAVKNYDLGISVTDAEIEDELVSKSVFFKVASFPAATAWKMSGHDLLADKAFASQDYLLVQPTLPDGYLTFHRKNAEDLFRYNNKLILSGISYEVSEGYPYLNAASSEDGTVISQQRTYSFKYYIKTKTGGDVTVIASSIGMKTDQNGNYMPPYGWIAYPDARCYKVDVSRTINGTTVVKSYDMKGHPGLNCAYAYIGLNTQLCDTGTTTTWDSTENRTYSEDNIIWASEMDNPFVFRATGVMSFNSKVITLAATTLPLSEGQIGQFDLYAFCGDGIRYLPVTETGEFAGSKALSMDVALSKKSVCSIEQAVVFVSKQGVMLLQGSSVSCISQNMRGKGYTLPAEVRSAIAAAYSGINQAYDEAMTFDQFVAESEVGYDYTNRRVYFVRVDKPYAYLYSFISQSWHKMIFGGFVEDYTEPSAEEPASSEPGEAVSLPTQGNSTASYSLSFIKNTYPDCYLLKTLATYQTPIAPRWNYIYDMGTVYEPVYNSETGDYDDPETLPGLVITRPLDLDNPDIRKSIRDIRIRGNAQRTHCKYILLGSMDGLNWGVLSSLNSGSYKFFRLVVISTMDASERIGWIEIEYETKFPNRLR